MTKKSKGNILYQVLIGVLIIVLIWAILYPKQTWKKQENLQNICRARMEALQQYEFQYFNNYQTYSDSIPKLIHNILMDSTALARLDSVLKWDKLIETNGLKNLVMQKDLPEDLKQLILSRFESGQPLYNLSNWDSLRYTLVSELHQYLSSPDSLKDEEILENSVDWKNLLSRSKILNILEDQSTSTYMRRYSVREYRRNTDLVDIRYWDNYSPYFHEELVNSVKNALRQDTWTGEDRKEWEEITRPKWSMQLDTLPQAKKDSIIEEHKMILWSQRKELLWKEDRAKLWKKEGKQWIDENAEVWKRILDKKWTLERKKEWLENKLASVPDTSLETFKAQKDSIWKTIVDSIKNKEYQDWLNDNTGYVNDVKKELFESDRRLTWEDEAYEEWIEKKEQNKQEFWQEIKDLMWKQEKDILWEKEQEKIKQRNTSLKKLDASIQWINILGEEKITDIVNNLELPDNNKLWNTIINTDSKTNSILYDLGIVALFNDTLIKSVNICPVAKEQYLVSYVDTISPPTFEIKCPIVVKDNSKQIMLIEPTTNDTTFKDLKIPFIEKIFGGREINNHGQVDNMQSSWEEKGS